MKNIVEIKNVTFTYDSNYGFNALNDINLCIEKGSFTVILGHNGSGKSTLAKLINGLLKPTKGEILSGGLNTSDPKNEFEIRRKFGLVFQNPDNQIVCSVVEEDVAFGPENLGVPSKEIRTRVDNALEAVGMTEFKNASPHHLSGGQKQRVALAGILAMEPECIILDEPTAMLDPIGRKEVLKAITKLNKEKGITVLLITHFMEEAQDADRVIIMNKGRVSADGVPNEIFKNSDLIKAAGLALPQSVELLLALKNRGLDTDTGCISYEAAAESILKAMDKEG